MNGDPTEWLNKARDDLATVELLHLFDEYPAVVACFHCQQTVEKCLKAFLVARDIPFFTATIWVICSICVVTLILRL